jgi:hypothetical protein
MIYYSENLKEGKGKISKDPLFDFRYLPNKYEKVSLKKKKRPQFLPPSISD